MKKLLLIGSIAVLSIALTIPAMADTTATAVSTTTSSSGGNVLEDNDSQLIDLRDQSQDKRVYEATELPAPAGEINYPGAPNMLGGATPSYMDRLKIKDILEYDEDGISLRMALQMRQDDSFMGKRIMVREKFGKMVEDKRLPIDAPMNVFFSKQSDMQSLGTITVVSDSKKSISADVFAEVVIKAHELGAVALHVKAEGFQRLVRNNGKGIGFTWSGTSVGNPGTVNAQTGVMGAGVSWGEAGYYDHPFIVVHALFPKGFKIGPGSDDAGNIMDWLKN